MSHFAVLVIGPDVEGQLAPFQENNMGDCPKQYLKFHEDEDSDDIAGKRGYWDNPNKKWDWYRVGGRWAGHFKLKNGASAPAATPGYEVAFGQEVPAPNMSDTCLKRDVDFDGMRNDAAHDAALEYDFVANIFSGLPEHKLWAEFRDNPDIEAARVLYHAQPRIAAWTAASKVKTFSERRQDPVDLTFGNPDDFAVSREHYIKMARERTGSTFAVLKYGKWYEQGEMGCFATVSKPKDPETWISMFSNLIDDLPDDTQLTVVDCHI